MTKRNPRARLRPVARPSNGSRFGPILLGVVLVGAFVAVLLLRGRDNGKGAASQTQATATPQAAAALTPTPLVIPAPAIPVPHDCPSNTAPGVDNPDRYSFCTPIGWGSYNENNSMKETLLMKPRPGGSPVIEPTEFDRIQILVALDSGAPIDEPADCQGPPNDSIGGWAAHHCSATLNPDTNPYHASTADFWTIDLAQDRKFYMTAQLGGDVSADDIALVNSVAHAVHPPGAG